MPTTISSIWSMLGEGGQAPNLSICHLDAPSSPTITSTCPRSWAELCSGHLESHVHKKGVKAEILSQGPGGYFRGNSE